jgi:hypothetical protein
MKTQTARKLATVLTMALLCGVAAAEAAVRIEIPEQGPGVPAYARIEAGRVIQDGVWAAIVFYRLPECVPQDFNLLRFVDLPRSFGCPLTVRGFEIWKNGPPPLSADPGPIQTESRGLGAVPIWFVKWSELPGAIADGTLTVPELWTIPSLQIGSAGFYEEGLSPAGVAQRSSLEIVAHGLLANGKSFQLRVSAVERQADSNLNVKISFR